MAYGFLDIAATPDVRAVQAEMGSAERFANFAGDRQFDRFTANEAAFIEARDNLFLASVSQTGWPYVQHRGGPPGFVKVLDERTLAFADYRGNRQYISVGNLRGDDRVAMILVDQAARARLKIFAHAQEVALDADPALTERVVDAGYKAKPERILRLTLVAFDWNCPAHIEPRFTQAQIAEAFGPVNTRLAALERENAELRARLAARTGDRPVDTPDTNRR
jgi:predicted pyridoxine 5'-phosphate oxidase superfamily flavin-nucleotide-binding protein